jgi:non-ribosomal peptide synthetase-like protein
VLTVHPDPQAALGDRLAALLADVVEAATIATDANFFDDLGADSMTMARFCARVRKQPDLPSISMRDIYAHPTLAGLSAALSEVRAETAPAPAGPTSGAVAPVERPPFRASAAAYGACGLLQLLVFLAYAWATVQFTVSLGAWVLAAEGVAATYGRGVLAGGSALGLACAIPVLVKWILVGRWQETEIRVWSVAYLRLWTVKSLLRISPIPFTAGTPIYNLFLRALGADVGRGALIVSRRMPLVTDLLTVGAEAVVRRNVLFNGYHAEAGRIRTGRVTIGPGAHVGEGSVLGLNVSIGADARLGHASSLQDGEQVHAGETRDGFGGQHSGAADGIVAETVAPRAMRPAMFSLFQVGAVVLVSIPLAATVTIWLSTQYDARTGVFTGSLAAWQTYAVALGVGAVSYVGYLVVTFLIAVTWPRLLRPLLVPGRAYPLYGVRYWAQRTVERRSNQPSWVRLVGDSSYVVPYLRAVGYRMPDLVQTGSNFGSDVKHDNPFLTTVGSGTMIADGLSVINVDYSGSSFRLSDTAVGARSFLGNQIVYPPQAAVGDDCLLGTKVMVPMTGPLRTGTGLLGAPAFEIPRTVRRDAEFQHLAEGENLRRGLAAKNRHNLVSMGLYALAASAGIAELCLVSNAALALERAIGTFAFALAVVAALAVRVLHLVLTEHASRAFRPLRPLNVSIYDRRFWAHERYWKFAQPPPAVLDGTPFKILTWRLVGVRIGRRVFDDGCAIVEKTLTAVGDDCTLNMRSTLQAHSQEDGAFKSDRIVVGSGCTLGTASLVHYGAVVGDRVVLAPDSFLMKGEEPRPDTHWAGNPAQEVS